MKDENHPQSTVGMGPDPVNAVPKSGALCMPMIWLLGFELVTEDKLQKYGCDRIT